MCVCMHMYMGLATSKVAWFPKFKKKQVKINLFIYELVLTELIPQNSDSLGS